MIILCIIIKYHYVAEYDRKGVGVVVQEGLEILPVLDHLLDEVLGIDGEETFTVALPDQCHGLVEGHEPVAAPLVVWAGDL